MVGNAKTRRTRVKSLVIRGISNLDIRIIMLFKSFLHVMFRIHGLNKIICY